MRTQHEAIRLADELADYSEGPYTAVVLEQAAAELRRLHSLNGDLLEALVMVRDADDDCRVDGLPNIPSMARAKIDAAIKKAEGV
jgi:hypothetical protein